MKRTYLGFVITLAIAALAIAGCGGGNVSTDDSSSTATDDPAQDGTYAEFADGALLVHFDPAISVEASISADASLAESLNVSVARSIVGTSIEVERFEVNSDGNLLTAYGAFPHLADFDIAITRGEGDDAENIFEGSASTSYNPASLERSEYGHLPVGFFGMGLIFAGDLLMPGGSATTTMGLYGPLAKMYMDPEMECQVGMVGFMAPQMLHMHDGLHNWFSYTCPAAARPSISKIGGGPLPLDAQTSFILYEDLDSDEWIARIYPSTPYSDLMMAVEVGDWNGDGYNDAGFIESSQVEFELGAAKRVGFPIVNIYDHNYLRIFFADESGSFAGNMTADEADVTIALPGIPSMKTIYDARILEITAQYGALFSAYYPATAHGDANGDGFEDIAYVDWFSDHGKIGVGMVFGSAEGGVHEEPDMIFFDYTEGARQGSIMNVGIGDLNRDGFYDVVAAIGFEYDTTLGKAGVVAYPPGEVRVFLGQSSWGPSQIPVVVDSAQAQVVMTEADPSPSPLPELARFTPYNLIVGPYTPDGFDDVVLASPLAIFSGGETPSSQGMAYMLRGRADLGIAEGDLELSTNDASVMKISGKASDTFFGMVVWPSGDLNNDGIHDILIGSLSSDMTTVNAYSFTPGAHDSNALTHQNANSIMTLGM